MSYQIFLVCLFIFNLIGFFYFKKQKRNTDCILVNGYKIRYNDFYSVWQVSHDEIGSCAEFKTKNEAINYAKNG